KPSAGLPHIKIVPGMVPFSLFLRWVRGIKGRYAPRWLLDAAYSGDGKARRHSNRHHQPGCMVPAGKRRAREATSQGGGADANNAPERSLPCRQEYSRTAPQAGTYIDDSTRSAPSMV